MRPSNHIPMCKDIVIKMARHIFTDYLGPCLHVYLYNNHYEYMVNNITFSDMLYEPIIKAVILCTFSGSYFCLGVLVD